MTTSDALIELAIRCRLGLGIDLALPCGRPLPKWRAAGWRYGSWRDRLTEVGEDVAHGRALGDAGNDVYLGTVERARQRKTS
ncbi:MAG: hypothetical protein IPO82_09010 [Betaproteobacteria bacterium]|nr:hypothetical protein [Betaproteobacteria bacterium]